MDRKAFKEDLFDEMIRDIGTPNSTAEDRANQTTRNWSITCDTSVPKRTWNDSRKPAYSWTNVIKGLRTLKARRKCKDP